MLLFLSQVHPKSRDTTPRILWSPSARLRAECGKTQRPLRAVLSRCCSIPLGRWGVPRSQRTTCPVPHKTQGYRPMPTRVWVRVAMWPFRNLFYGC